MKRNFLLAVTAATFLGAGTAQAATELLTFEGQFTPQVDTSIGVDIVGGSNPSFSGTDGINDIHFTENPGNGDSSGRFGVDSRYLNTGDDFFSYFQAGSIARNLDGSLVTYSNGDSVSGTDFAGSGGSAILYDIGSDVRDPGIIPNVGDSVILGFKFDIVQEFGCLILVFDSDAPLCEVGFSEFNESEEEFLGSVIATYYGFAQITHGSVVPGIVGINRASNQAAVVSIPQISAVPLPAAAWMLFAGLGGLAAAGRRKKA